MKMFNEVAFPEVLLYKFPNIFSFKQHAYIKKEKKRELKKIPLIMSC